MIVPLFALAFSLADPLSDLRADLARGTGVVQLPEGEIHLDRPLVITNGSHGLTLQGNPNNCVLVMDAGFKGSAAIVAEDASDLTFTGFSIRGNRTELKSDWYLPEHYEPFADYYAGNGIVVRKSAGVTVRDLHFSSIRAFPLIVSASRRVAVEKVQIEDSGTLNRAGRNNTTGGILLEEGVIGFEVYLCRISRVTGNAIWTHSYSESPRNSDGFIHDNQVSVVGRDAIQVGHATRVRVENNSGSEIGFPVDQVDVEHSAVAVVLDTAGNVDHSTYANNHFSDVNGQCIDLDGFHDGEVTGNACLNEKPFSAYPASHYGIVFGNNNPDSTSGGILVSGNTLSGFAYGGVFVVGSKNRIENNRFTGLNLAHCGTTPAPSRCAYALDQPDLLRSGAYLANNGGRPAEASGNIIRGNTFTGFGIAEHCVMAAPGVSLERNSISGNTCHN